MKTAHVGLPSTPLPGGGWRPPTPAGDQGGGIGGFLARNGDLPVRDPAGGQTMAQPAPRPPGEVPIAANAPTPLPRPRGFDEQRDASRPPREKGLLERVFGGG